MKLIKNDNNKEKFLGQAGGGLNRGKEIRSSSVDQKFRPGRLLSGQGDVKILTDSSTIPAINISTVIANQIPAKPFKTMPSPTRTVAAPSSASNCLKEIFEEGDAGSSDNSNTNTPRPIIRSGNSSNSTGPSTSSTHHHRRTKFHKSRTTSCSSSDASDDDNADKKRSAAAAATTNKMVDCAIKKQFNFQRRDSDSSDSQDPGTGCSGSGNNAGSSLILRNGASTTTTGGNSKTENTQSQQTGSGSGGEIKFLIVGINFNPKTLLNLFCFFF